MCNSPLQLYVDVDLVVFLSSLLRYDDYEEPKAGETSGDGTKLNSWVFIFWVTRKTQ